MVDEAIRCLAEGVLRSARDGDIGAVFGLGFPPSRGGPFRYADTLGPAELLRRTRGYADKYGKRFAPPELTIERRAQGRELVAGGSIAIPSRVMELSAMVLLLWASAAVPGAEPSLAAEPEIVILPLDTEGVRTQLGVDAWKAIVVELAQGTAKLRLSMKRHSRIHDLLLGPAREQARDCGANLRCLREIGSTLGADQIVAGKVAKSGVSLTVIDVRTGTRIATARSSPSPSATPIEARSRSAARNLIALLRKRQVDGFAPPPASAQGKEEANARGHEISTGPSSSGAGPDATRPPAPEDSPEATEIAPAASPPSIAPAASPPSIAPKASPPLSTAPEAPHPPSTPFPSKASPAPSPSAPLRAGPPSPSEGTSAARAGQARRGEEAPESLLAALFRSDEKSEITKTESRREEPPSEVPVTEKWWFWTTLGLAVFAGGTTAALLSGGLKGGPAVPSGSGTITGTY